MITPVALARNSMLRIRDGRGTTIAVQAGGVWITQSKDQRDYFVGAGQSFTVDRNGLTLIAAIARSMLRIEPNGRQSGFVELLRAGTLVPEPIKYAGAA